MNLHFAKIINRFLYHPITIVVITIVAISAVMGITRQRQRVQLSSNNLQLAKQELESANQQLQEIQQALSEAESPLAQEKIARNELLLQKEGELVIKLPDIVLQTPETEPPKTESNWETWWKLVKKK